MFVVLFPFSRLQGSHSSLKTLQSFCKKKKVLENNIPPLTLLLTLNVSDSLLYHEPLCDYDLYLYNHLYFFCVYAFFTLI